MLIGQLTITDHFQLSDSLRIHKIKKHNALACKSCGDVFFRKKDLVRNDVAFALPLPLSHTSGSP
jgi:hypothetical protein